MKHSVSSWKMSMALHSWSFEGEEEKTCRVEVYSIGETVQLFLNQKMIKQAKTKKMVETSLKSNINLES